MENNVLYLNQILEQFDGIITLTDQQHRCVFTNDYTANLFGFDDSQSLVGVDPYNMQCPAVESAQDFINQYQTVFQSGKAISVFDVHQYADGEKHMYMTRKSPIKDPITAQITHVMTVCTKADEQFIAKIFLCLQKQNQYHISNTAQNISFYFGQFPNADNLSNRQLECLYYLVQGKSAKEMALIMKLSSRTVESYLECIKIKLDIYNRSQLIEYAINLGLLHYIPESLFNQELSLIILEEG